MIKDEFIAYLKTATNPAAFGLREGRFYPYSTPRGRRIGYGFPVEDKVLFQQGCSQADAEKQLRDRATAALAELRLT